MEEKNVKAEVRKSGEVVLIHGSAPIFIEEAIRWIVGVKSSLRLVAEMCDVDIGDGWDGGFFQDAIRGVIDHPKVLCDDSIRHLINSFPDDQELKKYQPETEELEE